jgi:hypothetical protein
MRRKIMRPPNNKPKKPHRNMQTPDRTPPPQPWPFIITPIARDTLHLRRLIETARAHLMPEPPGPDAEPDATATPVRSNGI